MRETLQNRQRDRCNTVAATLHKVGRKPSRNRLLAEQYGVSKRRVYRLETGSFTGEDEIIVGKQRFGSIGNVPVKYDTQFLRFNDRSK